VQETDHLAINNIYDGTIHYMERIAGPVQALQTT
jgi:hypothetical protein